MGENTNHLTIKIGANSCENGGITYLISPSLSISPNLNSPSPPSSAFVSALQSPYISPRALEPPLAETISVTTSTTNTSTTNTTTTNTGTNTTTIPSPISYASNSDDIPSSSCTPPSEAFEQKHRLSDPLQPRVSFSFPIPRVSFTKGTTISSPSPNAKLRSCDVYIGYHGQNLNLVRFCKWLKSELEIQGIASFVADRAKYSDTQSHEIADRIICSSSFGVVVVTPSTFLNPLSIEEIRFFAQKKNLIPLLFDTDHSEIAKLFEERLDDDYEVLTKLNEFAKLEANDSNWRSCILKLVGIIQAKLGRKSIGETKVVEDCYELPFHRNKHFVGREKELTEIEASFFGCSDILENESIKPASTSCGSNGSSDGFADEECDTVTTNGKFISLEMKKCKEPTLEAWIEPVLVQRQRSKHKKSRTNSKSYGNGNMVCINGSPGIGKTELVVEYAYRYLQRYKKVLWVGGEARYFRQNLLNLSSCIGLDVSAESEKERGRIRSFEEQEMEAFQRVKRELFREVPYLLIIDNLETEKEWWEGKDLHDLIPRNTGATHVIITTRLSKVMNFDPIQLPPLSLSDSLSLLKGKKRKDYPEEEFEVLKKFDERLGRLTYGLWLVGSLLSELFISPSALFEAIERICINESLICDDGFSQNNPFLLKVLVFCFAVLDRAKGKNDLASRMVLAGAWFAPTPISSTLLANAADKLPVKGSSFQQWGKYCCISPQSRKNETDSALMLVKLGLAKRTKKQPGCWIQLHPITQTFAKRRGGFSPAKSTVQSLRKVGNVNMNSDHLWASAFLVFGFKSEPPIVQLKAVDMVVFIKKTALPLAIQAFMTYSRCNSALELLKVCTNVLEEVEKSFVSQIQDWNHGSLCWKKKLQSNNQRVDEYVWQDVTLLKATLLETRAKLLLRGGHFDSGEELCRTCISIRTVMLGHNHAQTLAAQETLAKLVRLRSKV